MIYKKAYIYPNKLELWEVFLKVHLSFKKIEIPNQAIKVLAYMCEHGINVDTQKKVIKDKICPNRQVYYNCRNALKTKGLIIMIRQSSWAVSPSLQEFVMNDVLDFFVRCKFQSSDTPAERKD